MRFVAVVAAMIAVLVATAVPAAAAPFDLRQLEDSFLRFDGEIYSPPGQEVKEGDTAGKAVAGDCDVTGDGAPDVVVAAPGATVGTQADAGRIYIVPGGARAPGSYSLPGQAAGSIAIEGSATGVSRELGGSLACAGDVNGDGAEDVVFGVSEGSAANAAYVVFGGSALVAVGTVALDALGSHGFRIEGGLWPGFAVAGLGDLDGDGKDEVAIGDPWGHFGARQYVGAVSVVAGRTDTSTVDLLAPGGTLLQVGGIEGDEVSTVAAAGDVDGDGVGDLIVGAPTHVGPHGAGSGAAYVVSGQARGPVDVDAYAEPGSSVLFPIWGGSQRSIGRALAGVGDVDGDGLDDLAVAESRSRTDSGGAFFYAVHVVYGKEDDAPVDTTKLRSGGFTVAGRHDPNAGDGFGGALAGVGDVDGDGHADIAIGADGFYNPVEPGKGPAAGAAYLIYGGAHPVDADVADLSCEQGAEIWGNWTEGLGKSIASAGDFDGSGEPQLLVGATRNSKEGNGHYALVIPLGDLAGGCEAEEPPVVEADSPQVDWGFRENFRRYVHGGFDPAKPAVPIAATGGAFCPANPDPTKGGCDPFLKTLPAEPTRRGALRFTPVGASATDGTDATIASIGRVTFRYPGHFFTLTLEDPWFAIAGNEVTVRARMDLDVDPSFTSAQSADLRVDVGTFPLAGPAKVTPGYVKWETGPGVLTPEAGAALGSFLGSGAELDPTSLTIPRGIAALPEEPAVPAVPDPVDKPGVNEGVGEKGANGSSSSAATTAGTPQTTTVAPARGRPVGEDGIARLSKLSCTAETCTVKVPKRVRVKIDGKGFWAKVMAPKTLGKGQKSPLRVKLPKPALTLLDGRSTMVKVRVAVRSGERTLVRILSVKVRYVPGAKRGAAPKAASGGAGSGAPRSAPIGTVEPPTLARPASAVDVSNVRITWFPRDSWVRYASSGVGVGDGIKVSGGATALESKASPCPDRPSTNDALLVHGIEFAPKASWYDPASGSAGVYGQGSVGFRWAAHTIDLNASDPEIEIAGASRAIFRFSGSGGTPYPNQRASLVSLDTAGKPTVSNGGKTFTYSLMRGTLTADGVNVFAGFYTPPDNDEFGCVSVEFTTP